MVTFEKVWRKFLNLIKRMSGKEKERFKFDHRIGLVTNASPFNQNLALLNTEDYYKADALAVAQEGFINYIPLVNTNRRCKYVPICNGCDRGKGRIKWMKWVKMGTDTYFVCLSTLGIQFFDVELTDLQFEYDFKELNSRLSLPLGACVLGDTLFVGAALGMIAVFKSNNETIRMINNLKVAPFHYLDGKGDCLVTLSREELTSYRLENGTLNVVANWWETLLLFSVMKTYKNILLIGHHNGEISILSFPHLNFCLREQVHEKEITAVDYSSQKRVLLTASDDHFVKGWYWKKTDNSITCIFKSRSEIYPFCGIGFTNKTCTEFCCVMSGSLDVKFFIENDKSDDTGDSSEEIFTDANLL